MASPFLAPVLVLALVLALVCALASLSHLPLLPVCSSLRCAFTHTSISFFLFLISSPPLALSSSQGYFDKKEAKHSHHCVPHNMIKVRGGSRAAAARVEWPESLLLDSSILLLLLPVSPSFLLPVSR